jgi:hypothetical protein
VDVFLAAHKVRKSLSANLSLAVPWTVTAMLVVLYCLRRERTTLSLEMSKDDKFLTRRGVLGVFWHLTRL